jgi:hypothetical protein
VQPAASHVWLSFFLFLIGIQFRLSKLPYRNLVYDKMPLCPECRCLDLRQFSRPQIGVLVFARDLFTFQYGSKHDKCEFCTLIYEDIEDLIAEIPRLVSDLCLLLKFFHSPLPTASTTKLWGINKLRVQIEPRPGMQGTNSAEWVPQRWHEYSVVADASS